MRAFRSLWRAAFGCALAAVMASNAAGSLTIELRPVGGGSNLIPIADPGSAPTVEMEIWGVVTDGNGNEGDDGLWGLYSAFRSSNGGLVLGDLSTDRAATIPDWVGKFWSPDNQYDADWLGYQNDLEGDIDMSAPGHANGDSDYHFLPGTGDGDLDIGHTNPSMPAPPWFTVIHAMGMQFNDFLTGQPVNEWYVATLTFDPIGAGPDFDPAGPSGVTEIWADPRVGGSQWTEDGKTRNNNPDPAPPLDPNPDRGDMLGGPSIMLYILSAAQAPAGGPVELGPGGPPVVLNGMASTGSINWWGWDFDGDGTYEIEGVGEGEPEVTYESLKAMGLEDMVPYAATMTVGWSASDPINTDTVGFDLMLVPEPATVALLAVGLVTLIRRRK